LQSFNDRFSQINAFSWELTAGLNRNSLLEDDRLGARVNGYIGKTLRLGSGGIGYALIGASARQYVNPGATYLNTHARLGLFNYTRLGVSQIEVAANSFQTVPLQMTLSAHHNLPVAKNHAIRIMASTRRIKGKSEERFSLSYRLYF
ncbi:unnamed protein product, partial [Hapterophycus canaliculatus]